MIASVLPRAESIFADGLHVACLVLASTDLFDTFSLHSEARLIQRKLMRL